MSQKKNDPVSSEFNERQKLIKLQMECDKAKHLLKMKELEYQRENDKIHHEREMERNRIKSAEIRKMQERRSAREFAESIKHVR